MTQFRCNICSITIVENSSVPDYCSYCGTSNGPWINLSTMKEERFTTTTSLRTPKSPLPPIPKRTRKKPAPASPKSSAGKPPSFTVTKPASTYFPPSPVYSPPVTPKRSLFKPTLTSGMSLSYFTLLIDFIIKIISSFLSFRKWPLIIAFAIVAFSLGKVFSYNNYIIASIAILIVIIPLIFRVFNIDRASFSKFTGVVTVPLLLLIFVLPYNFLVKKMPSMDLFGGNSAPSQAEVKIPSVVYIRKELNVRATPSTTGQAISMLNVMDSAAFTGRQRGEWIEVEIDGRRGWLYNSDELITSDVHSIQLRIINSMSEVNLREGPSTNYRVIRAVKSGEAVYFSKISADKKWIRVSDHYDNQGWLWRKYITSY